MELDIEDFKKRLEIEIAGSKSETQLAAFIYKEIREAETMKAGLMEEMDEINKDFLNDAAVQIDNYIFQLQEIEKELNLKGLKLDQQVALHDDKLRDKIADEIKTLHELDPEKYPDKENLTETY